MAANPRIDELRKRLEKSPESRLFAQLAEELRKGGELDEAIRVCRDGLTRHTNYPSARMTLGRALLDLGDLPAARQEFAAVLKGAPDNILAGRFLGECLEGMEDHEAALAQYKQTLVLAPGESHLTERIAALEQRLAEPKAAAEPIPVAAAEEDFEVEKPFESPPTEISERPPPRSPHSMAVPVIKVEEDFELERPAPGGMAAGASSEAPPSEAAPKEPVSTAVPEEPATATSEEGRPKTAPIPIVEAEAGFEVEEAYASPPTQISEAPPPSSPESRAIPVAQIQEPVELTRPEPGVGATAAAEEPAAPGTEEGRPKTAPVPIVEAEASFELEDAYASPPTQISVAPPPRSPESGAVPVAQIEEDFELERPGGPETVAPEAPAAEASPPVSREPGVAEGTPVVAEVADAKAPPEQAGAAASPSPAFGSETVAMAAAVPTPQTAPPARRPKSRLAEISPEHAAAAMGDLGGGKTTPLTSGTLAELYVSQGAPEKAIEIYEKLLVDNPGNEKARARLAALKAAVEPAAEPSAATARLSPRAIRRAAIERTIERLEAFLAGVKERKVSS